MPDDPQNHVTLKMQDDVAVITLDDGKANALSHDMLQAATSALDEAAEARAVVLAGRPGRFCAGFDLSIMTRGMDAAQDLVKAGAGVLLRLFTLPAPLVIAATGHAMAGGAVLLLTGDHCVGPEGEFKIGLNEVAIGMPLPIFAVELARFRLGAKHFAAATSLARIYDPKGALEAGYLHELAPPDDLLDLALERARALAATLKPRAFARTKEQARGAIARHVAETMDEDLSNFTVG